MAITPLPETTIHLLGSTQALTTPISLVKELIDNALDAKASSVDVMISPNTLERIEVKDNGHGIPQEDLNSLGKRGHTSKLRSFDELRTIGGVSLGFRGEALFSAVQLGQVSVTSKCYGEDVATMVKLKPSGGIETRNAASHPIGTTVTVTNFLSSLPVRKQTSLKEASKTLGKIKELLRAYCLARLHVKFSLRVIKGAKGSWSFSPRPTDGIKEVVSQAIGREVANFCIEKSLIFSDSADYQTAKNDNNQNTVINNDKCFARREFHVDMYLPSPDADFSKSSHGQYISIDARPVSHEKGTMRKIVSIYKQFLRNSPVASTSKIINPFLRVSIKCPIESYDPNIEPAKDDVIFDNEPLILKNFEEAFKNVYEESRIESNCLKILSQNVAPDNELLLIQEPTSSRIDNFSAQDGLLVKSPSSSTSVHISVISCNEESDYENKAEEESKHVGDLKTPIRSNDTSRKSLVSIRTPDSARESPNDPPLNPWLIARLSASKQQNNPKNSHLSEIRSDQGLLPTPQLSLDSTLIDLKVNDSLVKRKEARDYKESSISKTPQQMLLQIPNSSPLTRRAEDVSSDDDLTLPENNSENPYRSRGFVSARHVVDSEFSSPSEPMGPKRQKIVNRPFISPLKGKKNINSEKLYQTILTDRISSPRHNLSQRHKGTEEVETNPDLIWSMDYENRKEEATRKRREELRATQRKDCHDAIASMEDTCPIISKNLNLKLSSKVETSLPDNDPRGYFIRRQNYFSSRLGMPNGPKVTRAKSLRLPLERTPDNQELYQLTVRVKTRLDEVRNMNSNFGSSDKYIQRGSSQESSMGGLIFEEVEKEKLISVVKEMIERWAENVMPGEDQVEYHFENLITASGNNSS